MFNYRLVNYVGQTLGVVSTETEDLANWLLGGTKIRLVAVQEHLYSKEHPTMVVVPEVDSPEEVIEHNKEAFSREAYEAQRINRHGR